MLRFELSMQQEAWLQTGMGWVVILSTISFGYVGLLALLAWCVG